MPRIFSAVFGPMPLTPGYPSAVSPQKLVSGKTCQHQPLLSSAARRRQVGKVCRDCSQILVTANHDALVFVDWHCRQYPKAIISLKMRLSECLKRILNPIAKSLVTDWFLCLGDCFCMLNQHLFGSCSCDHSQTTKSETPRRSMILSSWYWNLLCIFQVSVKCPNVVTVINFDLC